MAVTKELKDAVERMQAKDETAFATFWIIKVLEGLPNLLRVFREGLA